METSKGLVTKTSRSTFLTERTGMKLYFDLFLPLQSDLGIVDDRIVTVVVDKLIPIIPTFPFSPI